jgi:hypothetical protein
VPTTPEAAAVKATASHAMAEATTTGVGETYTVIETATHTVRETAASEMGDTYAAAHVVVQATHAMPEAMIEAAVVRMPAIKYGGVAVVATVPIPAQRTAINRIGRQPVGTGVGLGGSRLRSSKCSRGQPNAGGQ